MKKSHQSTKRKFISVAATAVLVLSASSANTAFAQSDAVRFVKTLGPDFALSSIHLTRQTDSSTVPLKRLVQR